LVHSSIYDEFLERFLAAVSELNIGPVISEDHMTKVLSFIDLAVAEGGDIVAGGLRSEDDGFHIEATVITGLSHDSRTATEEIFGPVVTIHRFDSDAEAVEMANCTDYGLAGSVWSKNRGEVLAKQIESGMVWVNTWLHRDLRVPFGGIKDSGVGREGGMWSLGFFSEAINICVKHNDLQARV
jgi:aminomuconate-semialdehyde/2-hydroxymuconate-6-semialdehyde dehydrogenase